MKLALIAAFIAGAALLTISGSKPEDAGAGCVRCHEMNSSTSDWRSSSHRSIDCKTCHGGTLQYQNMVKLAEHLGGRVPEHIQLHQSDIAAMVDKCRSCHQQQFADWQSSKHSATYAKIFLDKKHNTNRPLMDDCLRCHGMHFEGGIRDLVAPVNRKGPWKLKRADLANAPVIPCLSCHSMHTRGTKGAVRSTLALYDRRDQQHVLAVSLPIPQILDGTRPVKISPDPRQAVCFQCHAALANRQVGSGDDRTPKGVHEGLSCLACHDKHGQSAKASCATCHPRWSNCGRDVEKMDTTFANKDSKHNVHWVRCEDCHNGVRPKPKTPAVVATAGPIAN